MNDGRRGMLDPIAKSNMCHKWYWLRDFDLESASIIALRLRLSAAI
jgi:hypothetical protein